MILLILLSWSVLDDVDIILRPLLVLYGYHTVLCAFPSCLKIHMKPLGKVSPNFGIQYQQYVDYIELYFSIPVPSKSIEVLPHSLNIVWAWIRNDQPQFNPTKTKWLLILGSLDLRISLLCSWEYHFPLPSWTHFSCLKANGNYDQRGFCIVPSNTLVVPLPRSRGPTHL